LFIRAQMVTAVIFLCSLVSGATFAEGIENPKIAKSSKFLFSSFETLDVRIEAPFHELKVQNGNFLAAKKLRIKGHLFSDGKDIPVELRPRGFSTLYFCDFPKFTLYLDEAAAVGTIFEKIKKVDVATHCNPNETATSASGAGPFFQAMKFNHREALLYKWLEILGIPSYGARPANMIYKDTSLADVSEMREQGFFIENLDAFLKRAGGIEIRAVNDPLHSNTNSGEKVRFKNLYTDIDNHSQLDRNQLARISFFNAFIGNGDSRLGKDEIWNLKIVELKDGTWFPIPMDFNLASMVLGPTNMPMNYNSMYNYADKALKLQLINGFIEKLPELVSSLSFLENDPEGLKNFHDALRMRATELENLKKTISLEK
jgi:hypothetical protein